MERVRKNYWIVLTLVNLAMVATIGFLLRTKFVFPLPELNYRNLLAAHSHTAFTGWLEMSLVLLIASILHLGSGRQKAFHIFLWLLQLSTWGMMLFFLWQGWSALSMLFSGLHLICSFAFCILLWPGRNHPLSGSGKLALRISLLSLALAQLAYIVMSYVHQTKFGGSVFYRDISYTYLHFLYNGFFSFALIAAFAEYLASRGIEANVHFKRFLYASVIALFPSLFLSLLWHNKTSFWVAGLAGGIFLVVSLYYLFRFLLNQQWSVIQPIQTKHLWLAVLVSFFLKTAMQCGTLVPSLGRAIFSDRPVIIGFLHLVFLALVSFYILGHHLAARNLNWSRPLTRSGITVFVAGVLITEALLMLQGLQILFRNNNAAYSWLLWAASLLLVAGAWMMFAASFKSLPQRHQG